MRCSIIALLIQLLFVAMRDSVLEPFWTGYASNYQFTSNRWTYICTEVISCEILSLRLLQTNGQLENTTLSVATKNFPFKDAEILLLRISQVKSPLKSRFM
uniref:Secreted protein n=1 Tax=Trichobilharzia regenti TaxID=157069 RepID=A0AA85K8G4_TRIRE|nr:unnamed protein product [Trichobilharzia regenti]